MNHCRSLAIPRERERRQLGQNKSNQGSFSGHGENFYRKKEIDMRIRATNVPPSKQRRKETPVKGECWFGRVCDGARAMLSLNQHLIENRLARGFDVFLFVIGNQWHSPRTCLVSTERERERDHTSQWIAYNCQFEHIHAVRSEANGDKQLLCVSTIGTDENEC